MSRRYQKPNTQNPAWLYQLVFKSLITKCAVLALLLIFLLQPVESVFAAEDDSNDVPTETRPESEPDPEPEPKSESGPKTAAAENETDQANPENTDLPPASDTDQNPEPDPEISAQEEEFGSEDDDLTTISAPDGSNETATSSVIASEPADEELATSTTEESSETETNSEPVENESNSPDTEDDSQSLIGTSASTSTAAVATTTEPIISGATTTATSSPENTTSSTTKTNTEPQPETETVEAASTEPVTPESVVVKKPPAIDSPTENSVSTTTATTSISNKPVNVYEIGTVTNNSNRHQFAESECVVVEDGAFYCVKDQETVSIEVDTAYVDTDADGDREIYLKRDRSDLQLTNNTYEDAAPYYDAESGVVVFHRLIGGRYQIIVYDLERRTESQLTDTPENNMQPTAADGYVVWQRWRGGDWEIALFDGSTTTIITDNSYHDVAPSIRNGYVIWSTLNSGTEKMLSVYDLTTGRSSLINDPEGGHVENPRFVLVYDTTFENGDVITKQYDPVTGNISPLGSKPAPLPTDLPEPEPGGETRAIVRNKSSDPEDITPEPTDRRAGRGGGSTAASTTASTTTTATSTVESGELTEETTLDLSLPTTTEKAAEILPLDEYDLIIEPLAASSSAQAADSSTTTDSVE